MERDNREYPTISIVIPTKNEEEWMHECLGALDNLDYPPAKREVIIVDGHSDSS